MIILFQHQHQLKVPLIDFIDCITIAMQWQWHKLWRRQDRSPNWGASTRVATIFLRINLKHLSHQCNFFVFITFKWVSAHSMGHTIKPIVKNGTLNLVFYERKVKKSYSLFGNFSQHGGGLLNPKTFVILLG